MLERCLELIFWRMPLFLYCSCPGGCGVLYRDQVEKEQRCKGSTEWRCRRGNHKGVMERDVHGYMDIFCFRDVKIQFCKRSRIKEKGYAEIRYNFMGSGRYAAGF